MSAYKASRDSLTLPESPLATYSRHLSSSSRTVQCSGHDRGLLSSSLHSLPLLVSTAQPSYPQMSPGERLGNSGALSMNKNRGEKRIWKVTTAGDCSQMGRARAAPLLKQSVRLCFQQTDHREHFSWETVIKGSLSPQWEKPAWALEGRVIYPPSCGERLLVLGPEKRRTQAQLEVRIIASDYGQLPKIKARIEFMLCLVGK